MKWQHSITTATNLEVAQRWSTWKNYHNENSPTAGRGVLAWVYNPLCAVLSRCLCDWCLRNKNVIVNVSVENSYSVLELKLLLTLFYNQNHQIPTRIWQTSTWLPVGKLGNSEARVGRKASVHYLMKCELQCHHKNTCGLSIHTLNTCIHLRIVFARKYLTIAS